MSTIAQYLIYLIIIIAVAWPVGRYISKIIKHEDTILSSLLNPIEQTIYRIFNIKINQEMHWKIYTKKIILISAVEFAILFIVQTFQQVLVVDKFSHMEWGFAFHTATTFVSNINYEILDSAEALPMVTKVLGFIFQNSISAAIGIGMIFALVRAFTRTDTSKIGNCYADIIKIIVHILIPLNVVLALILVAGLQATTDKEFIIGFIEMTYALLIPFALCFAFGENLKRERAIVIVIQLMRLVLVGISITFHTMLANYITAYGVVNTPPSAEIVHIILGVFVLGTRFLPMIGTLTLSGWIASNDNAKLIVKKINEFISADKRCTIQEL